MSTSAASYLILGFEVSKGDFFDNSGQVHVCSKCGKKRATRFCSACGGEVEERTVWRAKPAFAEYAKDEEDTLPEALWAAMLDDRHPYDQNKPGLLIVNQSQPVWEPAEETLAFGVIVSKCNGYSPSDGTNTVDLGLPYDEVNTAAGKLGIPAGREINLYHCLYYS
jgi:hypothetical protein